MNQYNQYFDKDNLYPSIKDIDIGEELEEFYKIRKHFLIFTEAGKPVYTRYGDEMVIAPFFATLSAIIPKVQSLFWNNSKNAKDNQNKVQWIESQKFSCAILKKGNFFYICFDNFVEEKFMDDPVKKSNNKIHKIKESSSFIKKQLEYLHL